MPDVVTELSFFINSQHRFFPFAPTTMKTLTSVLTVSALSFLVVAHGGDNLQARRHNARQAYSISSSHPSSTTSITPGPLPTNSANATLTANSTTSTLNYTITFLSTNPTAYPLSSIVSNQSSLPTMALTTTETPGPGPTNIPGAPPLPDSTFYTLSSLFRPTLNLTTFLDSFELTTFKLSQIGCHSSYGFTSSSTMDTGSPRYWH